MAILRYEERARCKEQAVRSSSVGSDSQGCVLLLGGGVLGAELYRNTVVIEKLGKLLDKRMIMKRRQRECKEQW